MKIVTAAEMALVEQSAQSRGVSVDALMENAGLAVARSARALLGTVAGAGVLVLVGPGNNGADGLVAARCLRRWGAEVAACVVTRRPDPDPKMDAARQYGVDVFWANDDEGLLRLGRLLDRSRLVIDAVLGTGRSRPIAGITQAVLERVNACRAADQAPAVLALDLPTGVDADTGAADPAGLAADVTVALGYPKVGLVTFPGAARVGRLEIADIGLPSGMPDADAVALELLTSEWVGRHLPARRPDSHKGTFGHALIVAGSRNYVGAACLATQAALRVGAGLVTLATPESVYPIAAGKLTEAIHRPLPEDADGRVHPDAAAVVAALAQGCDALAVGSGMGRSEGTARFLNELLTALRAADFPGGMPLAVDADGLNNLSALDDWHRRLPGPTVLTPHPGEMATLTRSSIPEVQRDRIATARRWAAEWGVSVVLKGAGTIVAHSGGLAQVSPFANPGLASGGTGDVLTGVIAGLMAQGLEPGLAAACGVFLHGQAGAAVTQRRGDAGTIASDLVDIFPETLRGLKEAPVSPPDSRASLP